MLDIINYASQLWEFELREDACFPCSHQPWCLIDKVQVCHCLLRSEQWRAPVAIPPIACRCNTNWHRYTWDTIGRGCTLFMVPLWLFGPFQLQTRIFGTNLWENYCNFNWGWVQERKKCLWCKQTALGCLLESLFAQLVVHLSMDRVANLKPRFLTNWSPVAHNTGPVNVYYVDLCPALNLLPGGARAVRARNMWAQRGCYYPCLQANKPAGQQLSLTLRPLAQHLLPPSLLRSQPLFLGPPRQVGSNSGGITALTTGNFLCQRRLCRQRLAVSKLFPFDRRPRINEAMRLSAVHVCEENAAATDARSTKNWSSSCI